MEEIEGAEAAGGTARVPRWRRILAFPLVALVFGFVALKSMGALVAVSSSSTFRGAGTGLAGSTSGSLLGYLQPILLTIGYILALKLVIRHLGAIKRDDLPFDARSRDFPTGILYAALLISLVVGIAALLGGYRITGWGGGTSLPWLLVVAGFKAAFVEEILYRGVIFRFLEEFAGSVIALILSALLFGFIHRNNPGATPFTTLAIAVQAGVLLTGAYMLTRNLWFAIGLHWGWNVTQGFVWDVPVSGIAVDGMLQSSPAGNPLISGGAFGLEGSIIATVLVTATGMWLIAKAARLGRVVKPMWVRRREGLPLPRSSGPLATSLTPRD